MYSIYIHSLNSKFFPFSFAYACTSQYQQTALHYASDAGHTDIVQVLVDAKADVNARDEVSTVIVFFMIYKCLQND